jgi:hypothetical protein
MPDETVNLMAKLHQLLSYPSTDASSDANDENFHPDLLSRRCGQSIVKGTCGYKRAAITAVRDGVIN